MRKSVVLPLVLVLAATSCQREVDLLTVVSGSTAKHLVFRLVQGSELSSEPISSLVAMIVSRFPCDSARSAPREQVWSMGAVDGIGSSLPPKTLIYGVTPSGYVTEVGPMVLAAGCYEALVLGARVSAQAYFEVAPNGSVTLSAPAIPGASDGA